jgi:peptidoglycan/xylan/chitin deacetylase (PgdA/CDA1 family)
MATLLAGLDGAALPRNPVMITFDDGYRSCRDIALPILRELGVPATFFIATGFPGVGKLYWWEQIAAVLHAARGASGDAGVSAPAADRRR